MISFACLNGCEPFKTSGLLEKRKVCKDTWIKDSKIDVLHDSSQNFN